MLGEVALDNDVYWERDAYNYEVETVQVLTGDELVKEIADNKGKKYITLTDKGFIYLEKYKMILGFISEFEL